MNNNLILIVIAAVGAWLFFSDQIKDAWNWIKERAETVRPSITESTSFDRIRSLIAVAEEAENLGVPKAGGELRQAAANELLKQVKKDDK